MTVALLRDRWILRTGLLLLVAAVALRCWQFGNPAIQIDEQFYLLTGDRMWQGALPYVDIWDRKPVGLFLIYAAIRLLGGDGIIQYQIVATLFAAATALVIALLARRIAPERGALAGGLVYLVFLMGNGGDGGQAPVFYNLLTVSAVWCVVRVIEQPRFDGAAFRFGCAAMALIGVALQVKYSVLFEGMFLGLALIAIALRKGAPAAAVAGAALLWIALALLPTLLALGWYLHLGATQVQAFLFSNFESILLRPSYGVPDIGRRIVRIVTRLLPLGLAALAGCLWFRAEASDTRRLFAGWAIMAVIGLVLLGTYHDHYALALLPPFALVAAPAFAWLWRVPRLGIRIAPVALAVGLIGLIAAIAVVSDTRRLRGGGEVRAMAAQITLDPGETLFVFSGDPILYHLTGSPLPTRWNFPTLLSERRDADTLGTDMHAELARVMATRPQYIVTRDGYPFPEADPVTWAMVDGILAREYRLVLAQRVGPRRKLLYRRMAP